MNDFPIKNFQPIIYRDSQHEEWKVAVYDFLEEGREKVTFFVFLGESYSEEVSQYGAIAPLAGNEKIIGQTCEAEGQWDQDIWIEKKYGLDPVEDAKQAKIEAEDQASLNWKINHGFL